MKRLNRLLSEMAPELCRELRECLEAAKETEAAAQIEGLIVQSWRYDEVEGVLAVSVRSGQPNTVRGLVGSSYGRTIPVNEVGGILQVDVDNTGRIFGIEAFGRPSFASEFARHAL